MLAWILLPLLVLGGDLLREPIVFDNITNDEPFSVNSLLEFGRAPLGNFKSHSVAATLQPLFDQSFQKTSSRTGIVISHFVDVDSQEYKVSALGTALLQFLSKVEPSAGERLRTMFADFVALSPGTVQHLDLGSTTSLPYRDIFVVIFETESPTDDRLHVLSEGMKRVYSQVIDLGVEVLYVPCLTYRWEDRQRINFGDLFDAILTTTPSGRSPRHLELALYSQYPSFVLEDAVDSLRRVWGARLHDVPNGVLALHNRQFRMLFTFLSLSLAVSFARVPLTPLNVAKVAVLFLVTAETATALIGFVVPETDSHLTLSLQILSLLLLALLLPTVPSWNYRSVFQRKSTGR